MINWKYFVVVAEELNFTKAAEKLYLTQQSLSSMIAKLEKSLDIELFFRKKKLELTPAGECLYRHAKKIVIEEELLNKELQDLRSYKTGSLKIGVQTWLGMQELSQVLPELKRKYPQIHLTLLEGSLKKLTTALREGQIDLMFGYLNEDDKDIESRVYHTEQIILAIPETLWNQCVCEEVKRNLANKDTVRLQDFQNCPFIRTNQTSWFDQRISEYCRQSQIHLRTDIFTGSIETQVSLCLSGLGAIICPEHYLQLENMKDLKKEVLHHFYLKDSGLTMHCAVQTLKNRYLPQIVLEFISIARQNLSGFQD